MNKNLLIGLYIALLIVVIVAVDVLFFRGQSQTQARLLVNLGIVLVDAAFYLVVLRRFLN